MTGSKLCVLAKPPNAHFYCTSKPVSGGSSWPSEHSPGFPKWGSRQCSPTIRWESLKTLLKIKIWREAKTKTKASCKSKLTTSYIFSFPPVSFSSFNAFDHEVQICKMQRQKKKRTPPKTKQNKKTTHLTKTRTHRRVLWFFQRKLGYARNYALDLDDKHFLQTCCWFIQI